nr:acyltransferase [Rhizobium sp. CSW-27]
MRAFAAFLVLFAHADNVLKLANVNLYDGWIGGIGVDIFFTISGYIMFSVMDGKPAGAASAWQFAVRRVGRIVPIYWLVTLAVLAAWWLTGADLFSNLAQSDPGERLVASLLFFDRLPIVAVGWTLCFEMVFYALASLSLLAIRSQAGRLLGISTVLLLFVILRDRLELTDFYPGEPTVISFVLGGVIWMLLDRLGSRHSPVAGLLLLAAAVAGMAGLSGNHELNHGAPSWIVVSALFVLGTLLCEPLARRVAWRLPVMLGDASYSLYLVHLYVVYLAGQLAFEVLHLPSTRLVGILFIVFNLIACSVLSMGLYRHVERPLTVALVRMLSALGDSVSRRRRGDA